MQVFHSPDHALHAPLHEFEGGRLIPAYETPKRIDAILAALRDAGFPAPAAPAHFGHEPLLRVHGAAFLDFLKTAFPRWRERHGDGRPEAFPSQFPARTLRAMQPDEIEALLGYYTFDMATPILEGTWPAAISAANAALSGAQALHRGASSAFALARPPGHHAAGDLYGGYCFLNNTAIAAQWLHDLGRRVAILDVDCHHGNGTQTIFYGRGDLLTISIHGDPRTTYPFYLGYADERGEGAGDGANLNLPLPAGSMWDAYSPALETALARVRAFGADTLVVALGVDNYRHDPVSTLALDDADYSRMGAMIGALKLPTLFVMEGGYAIPQVGALTARVLSSFLGR